MPRYKSKFSESWAREKDVFGDVVGSWCHSGNTQDTALCTYCKKEFSIANSGLRQILQHAKTDKHKKLRGIVSHPKQTKLVSTLSSSSSTGAAVAQPPIKISHHVSDVSKAEAIWGLKVASADYTYRSCDKISDTFAAMFQCPIAADFTMSRSKVSYMISDAFGPYFTERLIYDVNKSKEPFTLHYDETTTTQNKRQMDLHLRYWSESSSQVESKYYSSLLFDHAEGKVVADAIMEQLTLDGVEVKRLSALGSDGPNVNKTVFRTIDASLKESGFPGLVNVGTCNLHVVHNSFGKALEEFPLKVNDMAVEIHSFFKYSTCRTADFRFTQLEEDVEQHVFIRHVPTRWLTLGPVIDRITEQWAPLCSYFNELSKKPEKEQPKCKAFKSVHAKLQSKSTLAELLFIQSVRPCFEHFLTVFQDQVPLIHILYDEMETLVTTLMSRFIEPQHYQNKSGEQLVDVDVTARQNQLKDEDLIVGEMTTNKLKKMDHGEKKRFYLSVRKFYSTLVKYLITRFPLRNEFIRSVRCLQPQRRTEVTSHASIQQVARMLPSINDEDLAKISDEWRVYQIDDDNNGNTENQRIDHYWRDIFKHNMPNGDPKYPTLQKVVKAVLVLPHGNADCERGLSKNKKMLGKDRTNFSLKSIIGNRLAKDAVIAHNGQPENVPITREMMLAVKNSHHVYQQRLDLERKQKEEAENDAKLERETVQKRLESEKKAAVEKKEIIEKEKELDAKEATQQEGLKAAEGLLKEGSEKLKDALQQKDNVKASLALLMIEKAQSSISSATNDLDKLRSKQKSIENRKRKLIEKLTSTTGEKSKKKTKKR